MQNVIFVLVGLALGMAVVYALLRRYIARLVDPASVLEGIRKELGSVLAELNQTTERNVAILEDRIRRASELVKTVDKKLVLLRRESDRHEEARQAYASLWKNTPRQTAPGPDRDHPAGEKGAPPEQASPGGRLSDDDVRGRVLVLFRRGFEVRAIAKQLDLSPGEVELIVALGELEEQGTE